VAIFPSFSPAAGATLASLAALRETSSDLMNSKRELYRLRCQSSL
jgi:hypothetical protein